MTMPAFMRPPFFADGCVALMGKPALGCNLASLGPLADHPAVGVQWVPGEVVPSGALVMSLHPTVVPLVLSGQKVVEVRGAMPGFGATTGSTIFIAVGGAGCKIHGLLAVGRLVLRSFEANISASTWTERGMHLAAVADERRPYGNRTTLWHFDTVEAFTEAVRFRPHSGSGLPFYRCLEAWLEVPLVIHMCKNCRL